MKPRGAGTDAIYQRVCCSSGPFPVPKQGGDGSCASHLTVRGDTCWGLALGNGIEV